MKATVILGSPRRNGNSDTMAAAFSRRLEKGGAKVKTHNLWDLRYDGCFACDGCKAPGRDECILRDDLTPVLADIKAADVVALATPVYFFDSPAKVKAMLDRWYSFFLPRYWEDDVVETRMPPGKKAVLLVSQGAPEGMYRDFLIRYSSIFAMFDFLPPHVVRGASLRKKDAAMAQPELLRQVEIVADRVLAGAEAVGAMPSYWDMAE